MQSSLGHSNDAMKEAQSAEYEYMSSKHSDSQGENIFAKGCFNEQAHGGAELTYQLPEDDDFFYESS